MNDMPELPMRQYIELPPMVVRLEKLEAHANAGDELYYCPNKKPILGWNARDGEFVAYAKTLLDFYKRRVGSVAKATMVLHRYETGAFKVGFAITKK